MVRGTVPDGGTGSGPPDADGRLRFTLGGAEETQRFGRALARLLRPGDLLLLSGELGAGKTTLTRGIGAGLDVRGPVASPTFVIARVHPALSGGPALVHVDAYRLGGGLDEMEDLDLDLALPESVVVVEWGEGKVEELAENRLHIALDRAVGGADPAPHGGAPADAEGAQGEGAQGEGPEGRGMEGDEPRTVTLTPFGPRWAGVDLAALSAEAGQR